MGKINELPLEVLVQILSITSKKRGSRRYWKSLHLLAQVCRQWLVIIKGSPVLWTEVSEDQPKWAWTAALALSRTHPLHITLRFRCQPFDGALWGTVVQRIPHWEEAVITAIPPQEQLRKLESVPALRLRHFSLLLEQCIDAPVVLDLFSGQAPGLRSLKLENVALPSWDSCLLAGLQSLSLENIHHSRLSFRHLVSILHANPNIRDLRLVDVFEVEDIRNQYATIILPELRKLTLALAPSATIGTLISTLEAPKCAIFEFTPSRSSSLSLESTVLSFISPSFQQCLGFSTTAVIRYGAKKLYLSLRASQGGRSRFRFEFRPTNMDQVLDWVVDGLNSIQASSLRVFLSLNTIGIQAQTIPVSTLSRLQSLRTVSSLSLRGYKTWPNDILLNIASPTNLVDGTPCVPWPCLVELSFKSAYCSPAVVLAMVKAHMEAWVARRPGEGGIARLEKFSVVLGTAMDTDSFAEIQTIIGKDKSHWITTRPIVCRDGGYGRVDDDETVV
ncbi:hypothetical protein FRB94_010482 [Tulasnella sp. JGI-2019a]|nr:hypothetical protein FRB94_010482 [Tulasnella sp. JGI-2019a]